MFQENWLNYLLFAIILLAAIARRVFIARGSRGAAASYGVAGATVCRKCGRAFARSIWAPNLVVGKLTRCPHCRAWAVLPAASQSELEIAEARDRASGPEELPPANPDEVLARRIEQSRYENFE
jgi:hypothetical protein